MSLKDTEYRKMIEKENYLRKNTIILIEYLHNPKKNSTFAVDFEK